ncbi:MAG TPA: NAD(P)-dependent oxidoreductase [Bacteroidetes bacterium]|nr:NAD(P)-dependent oxidoreductase [Bacteroidota bacterium]
MKDKKVVLLTGASGMVGREVLRKLVHLGDTYQTRVFDLDTRPNRHFYHKYQNEVHFFPGDIRLPQDLEAVTQGVDFVIHLAALIPPAADHQEALAKEINFGGTENLLAALERNSPHAFLIYSSSISLYGDRVMNPWIQVDDPFQPSEGDYYAVTKKMAEDSIRASSIKWTIFRLSGIFNTDLKPNPLAFYMPLDTCLELTTSRDTGYAMVAAMEHAAALEGNTFNLGGGEKCRLTFREFLDESLEAMGLGAGFLPEKAFAEKNFHCGYYADSNVLNEILHFQRDTKGDYFAWLKESNPNILRALARLARPLVRWYLLRQSDPLKAIRSRDKVLLNRFFHSPKNHVIQV